MKKLETKSTVLLKHHLKALKMPTMHDECEKIAARCAKENVDHLGFLLQLCEQELIDREKRSADRRLKAAKFPNYKTLEECHSLGIPSPRIYSNDEAINLLRQYEANESEPHV